MPNKALRGCEQPHETWLGGRDPHEVYQGYSDCMSKEGANAESCLNQSVTDAEIEYLKCYTVYLTSTTWHMGGTARIGSCDDELAVVDNRCR